MKNKNNPIETLFPLMNNPIETLIPLMKIDALDKERKILWNQKINECLNLCSKMSEYNILKEYINIENISPSYDLNKNPSNSITFKIKDNSNKIKEINLNFYTWTNGGIYEKNSKSYAPGEVMIRFQFRNYEFDTLQEAINFAFLDC